MLRQGRIPSGILQALELPPSAWAVLRGAQTALRAWRASAERAFPSRPRLKAKTFLPRPGSRAFQREPKESRKEKEPLDPAQYRARRLLSGGLSFKNILDVVDQITHRVGGLAGLLFDLFLIAHQLRADIAHHHAGCQAGADPFMSPMVFLFMIVSSKI